MNTNRTKLGKTDRKILTGNGRVCGGWRIANSLSKLQKAGLIKVTHWHTDSSPPPLGFRRSFYCEARYQIV